MEEKEKFEGRDVLFRRPDLPLSPDMAFIVHNWVVQELASPFNYKVYCISILLCSQLHNITHNKFVRT